MVRQAKASTAYQNAACTLSEQDKIDMHTAMNDCNETTMQFYPFVAHKFCIA